MSVYDKNKIIIYSKTTCPWCTKAKIFLNNYDDNLIYDVIELDKISNRTEISKLLVKHTQLKTLPNIFVGDYHVGGFDDLQRLGLSGQLDDILDERGF